MFYKCLYDNYYAMWQSGTVSVKFAWICQVNDCVSGRQGGWEWSGGVQGLDLCHYRCLCPHHTQADIGGLYLYELGYTGTNYKYSHVPFYSIINSSQWESCINVLFVSKYLWLFELWYVFLGVLPSNQVVTNELLMINIFSLIIFSINFSE